jgi:C1A family cysteine protease
VEAFQKLESHNPLQILEYLRKGPVAVGICGTDKSFMFYARGIYNAEDCCVTQNHAVLIVGYGHDDVTGLDYWIALNSWAPMWGERGYVRLLR